MSYGPGYGEVYPRPIDKLPFQEELLRPQDVPLDPILDGLPARDQDGELVFLLAGPFGVDWRTGREPQEAPPAAWEPIVLELGEPVAVAFHLDPLWADDPADYA